MTSYRLASEALKRARAALDAAYAERADPWRIQDLRAREAAAVDALRAAEEHQDAGGPRARIGRGGL